MTPGVEPEVLAGTVDAAVRNGLQRTGTPGAVLRLDVAGQVILRQAWGAAQDHDHTGPLIPPIPMHTATMVDIASITKVAATTAVAMVLVQDGLDLAAPARRWVPELASSAGHITLAHLLEHTSGLPAWAPLFRHAADPDAALAQLCALPLHHPPGTTREYSDLGMVLLGVALQRIVGRPLDVLANDLVHRPLGMTSTTYRPDPADRPRCAATSTGNPVEARMLRQRHPELLHAPVEEQPWWRPRTLLGEVNDANAGVAFGGVAGHAGLFSTIDDLCALGRALEQAARGTDGEVFSAEVVQRFVRAGAHPGQALGFWTGRFDDALGPDGQRVDDSFGHRGFTGCELLVSPRDRLVLVLLTNRLHGGDPPPAHDPLWQSVLQAVRRCLP